MGRNGLSLFNFDREIIADLKNTNFHNHSLFLNISENRKRYFFNSQRANCKTEKSFCLVGIDEAGRGCWAGPVVAAAVVLDPNFFDVRINDSKKLIPELRFELYKKLKKHARWAVGVSPVSFIDSNNILQATYSAMKNALDQLIRLHPQLKPDLILVDGRPVPQMGFPQKSIVRGDSKSAAIASASIIAKVVRDKKMVLLDKKYPQYGFARHKGYGTDQHFQTLQRSGPSPIHRKSFAPVLKMIQRQCDLSSTLSLNNFPA